MASSSLKPGVPITLRELEPSSDMFKQGASLRVTGNLQSYDVDFAISVIQDGSVSLKVDTRHLRDISFRTNSTYQFIGELLIQPDNDAILQARVGRNIDGLDLNLYQQSLLIRRQYEAKLRSSRLPGGHDPKPWNEAHDLSSVSLFDRNWNPFAHGNP